MGEYQVADLGGEKIFFLELPSKVAQHMAFRGLLANHVKTENQIISLQTGFYFLTFPFIAQRWGLQRKRHSRGRQLQATLQMT